MSMESTGISSATLVSVEQDETKQGSLKGIDQQLVKDLIQHFFANPPFLSSSSILTHISPHLTISLPYLQISPPTFDQFNSNSSPTDLQNSTSAKSLAIFHLPILAVNTLPRSNWSLSISDISPLSTDSPFSILAQFDPKLVEERSIEIWTADLQWTLRFGSINTTTTGVDGINPSLAYQAGSRDENYDDWVSDGEKRKVELVFVREKDRGEQKERDSVSEEIEGTNKGGKGKRTAVDEDEEKGNERDQFQLVHLQLSLPDDSITPASLLDRFVPTFLQPFINFLVTNLIAPISLFFAFRFLRYLHLDQGSARLQLPSPSPPSSVSSREKSRSRSRSRSRTPRPLRQTSLFPTSTSTPTISSSIPSVLSTLHVELPSPLPTPDEIQALQSIRSHSDPSLPSPRIIESLDSLSCAQQQQASVISMKSLLSLLWAVLAAIVSEVGELYYLIARVVVLFTEVVMAMGEVFRDGVKTSRRHDEGMRVQTVQGESPTPSPSRISVTTHRRPSIHSHSHPSTSSKRVSFPSLSSHFATIIGYASSPGTSTPSSPAAPPPSLVDENIDSPVKLRFDELEMRKFGEREKVARESEMREISETEKGVDEGAREGEDAVSVRVGSSVLATPSASDYPTPSSRLSSLPSPSTESFEPPSPSNSSSSSIAPIPLESPNLPLSTQLQGEVEEMEESAPTSPEVSRRVFDSKAGEGGGNAGNSKAVGSERGRKDGDEVGEKKGTKRGGAKGRKRKGRK